MPEMSIKIGTYTFSVTYTQGESQYLEEAAKNLDETLREATDFASLSRKQTLLLAGLHLADKFAGVINLIESLSENRASGKTHDTPSGLPYGVDKRNVKDIKLWAKVDDPSSSEAERRAALDKILEREAQRRQQSRL